MKKILPISLLVLAVTLSGCSWVNRHLFVYHPGAPKTATAADGQTIVTPDNSLAATVFSVNLPERYLILTFPSSRMPPLGQHMFLYRNGLRTAEVKIVGPQQDNNIVADLVSGEPQPGDLVREE